MKRKNRLLAILLAFAMAITYMPALAFAEEITEEDPAVITENLNIDNEEGTDEGKEDEATVEEQTDDSNPESEAPVEFENAESKPAMNDLAGEKSGEKSDNPKITGLELTLSTDREDDDKTLWGYIGSYYSENFPYAGDTVNVSYDNNTVEKYVYGYDEMRESSFFMLTDEEEIVCDENGWSIILDVYDEGVGIDMNDTLKSGENDDFYIRFDDRYDNYRLYKTTVIGKADEGLGFTYTHNGDITVYEGRDGWYEYPDDSEESKYFYYEWKRDLPAPGDEITITKDDDETTYIYSEHEYEEDGNTYKDWDFISEDGMFMEAPWDVLFTDNQRTTHWDADKQYSGKVMYHGVADDITINTKSNPIESISFKPNGKTSFSATELTAIDENGDEYLDIGLRGDDEFFFVEGDELTIYYSEDSGMDPETYEYVKETEDDDEFYYWLEKGVTDGNTIYEVQPDYPQYGDVVNGNNVVSITYLGKTTTCIITIEGLGHEHVWGEPEYDWADDYSTVTATAICTVDGCNERLTETVNTTSQTEAASCDEPGTIIYTAEFSENIFSTQTEEVDVDAVGHDWGEAYYEWAEDYSSVTATRICKRDSSHKEIKTVNSTSSTTPATCEKGSTVTYTADFEDAEFETQVKVVKNDDALGHDWGEPTYEWAEDYSKVTATRVCTRDENHVETEEALVSAAVTKQPTCEEKGETTYTPAEFTNEAFVKQEPKTEEIDALGHAWGEPAYVWADDFSTVTATRICGHDPSHKEDETVAATSAQTKDPTCTEKGETTYTSAGFDNTAFSVQTKTVANIDALGHDWSEWEVTQKATCVAAGVETRTCQRDGYAETREIAIDPDAHDWDEGKITERATKDEAGEITYKCTLCGAENPEKGVIAPLGHDPINQEAEAAIAVADSAGDDEAEALAADAVTKAGTAVENAEAALNELLDDPSATEAEINAARQDLADAEATESKAEAVAAKIKAKKSAKSASNAQAAAAAQASAGTDAAVNAAQDAVTAANTAKGDADAAVAAAEAALAAAQATGDAAAIEAANTALTDAQGAQTEAAAAVIAAEGTYGTAVAARNAAIAAAQQPVEILDLPAVKISKPKAAKKKITVKWKKVSKKNLKKISGIQIQVATDPGFTNIVKTATAGKKKTSKVIKGLQPKTKYYVRIRAYAAGNHYSVWKGKSAKVK